MVKVIKGLSSVMFTVLVDGNKVGTIEKRRGTWYTRKVGSNDKHFAALKREAIEILIK